MDIIVNGEMHRFEGAPSVADLVARLKVDPAKIALERNREIIPRSTYGQVMLAEGDAIEIVRFIGGG